MADAASSGPKVSLLKDLVFSDWIGHLVGGVMVKMIGAPQIPTYLRCNGYQVASVVISQRAHQVGHMISGEHS